MTEILKIANTSFKGVLNNWTNRRGGKPDPGLDQGQQYRTTQNYCKIEGKADRTARDCTSIVKKVKEYLHKCK